MKQDLPILHGRDFGGGLPQSDGTEITWLGRFLWMGDNTWAFVFLNEHGEEVWEISGTGTMPRTAFENCVQAYIAMNEGQESPTLREILPVLRQFFNDDGGVKLEHLLAV